MAGIILTIIVIAIFVLCLMALADFPENREGFDCEEYGGGQCDSCPFPCKRRDEE